MVSVWLFVGMAFLIGMFIPPVLSFLIGPALPRALRDPLGKLWAKITLATFGSSVIVRTSDGHYKWVSVSRDEDQAFKADVNGDTVYFKDKNGSMGSLFKEKFGVAYEGLDTVLDPALAKVGEQHQRETRADGGSTHGRWVYDESGQRVKLSEYLRVPDGIELVNMQTVMDIVRHAGDPGLAKRQEERAKISQNKFSRGEKAVAGILLLGAVALGAGIYHFAGGGGGGAVPVPGLLDTVGVFF